MDNSNDKLVERVRKLLSGHGNKLVRVHGVFDTLEDASARADKVGCDFWAVRVDGVRYWAAA